MSNVLIGAPGLGLGPGAAYLFDGTTGALLRTFVDPSAPPGDPLFGYSVATAGGNVLVGDPRNDTGETDAGAAHLFDAGTGTLLRTFTSPTPSLSAEFGASIATHGGYVLIAPNFGLTAVVFDMGTGAVSRTLRSPFTGAMSAVQVAFADGQPVVGTQFQGPVYVYCGGAVGCGPCETCGPAGTCVVAPTLTCQPRVDGRMPLRIVNSSTNDARDQVRWSAVGDFEQLPGQENEVLGLPGSDVVNDDYTLCLYDASGAPPNLLFRATAPAAGTCGNDPCWTLSPNCSEQGCGYRYRDSERAPEGVRTIVAKNRDNLKFVATGVNLSDRPGGLPTLPLPLPLRVQLQIREGLCWEADYSAAKANTPMQFRANAD